MLKYCTAFNLGCIFTVGGQKACFYSQRFTTGGCARIPRASPGKKSAPTRWSSFIQFLTGVVHVTVFLFFFFIYFKETAVQVSQYCKKKEK